MPAVPRPGYMYSRGHDNDGVDAVIRVLEDWFNAMGNGTVSYRLPSTDYPKHWTVEELDRLVIDIDAEVDKEVPRVPGTQSSVRAQAGPGFQRLAPAQRLALTQELHATVLRYKTDLRPLFPVGFGIPELMV